MAKTYYEIKHTHTHIYIYLQYSVLLSLSLLLLLYTGYFAYYASVKVESFVVFFILLGVNLGL